MPVVTYTLDAGIARITMDDGKANVMSPQMLGELDAALDNAMHDEAVVVVEGRHDIFSGGYDMAMFDRSEAEIFDTIRAGGELVHRLVAFPTPVLVACRGHAIAQGAFVVLSADTAIGCAGGSKIGLNEVAIGLTIPTYGVEIARSRLSPSAFAHATTTARLFGPDDARAAGFFDVVADPGDFDVTVAEEAARLRALDPAAHRGTKRRARAATIDAIRRGIDDEFAAAVAQFG